MILSEVRSGLASQTATAQGRTFLLGSHMDQDFPKSRGHDLSRNFTEMSWKLWLVGSEHNPPLLLAAAPLLSLTICFSFLEKMPDVHREPRGKRLTSNSGRVGVVPACPGSCSPEDWGLALPRQRKELMVTLRLRADVTKSSFSLSIFVVPTLSFLNLFPY